jgi:hypothetical protein
MCARSFSNIWIHIGPYNAVPNKDLIYEWMNEWMSEPFITFSYTWSHRVNYETIFYAIYLWRKCLQKGISFFTVNIVNIYPEHSSLYRDLDYMIPKGIRQTPLPISKHICYKGKQLNSRDHLHCSNRKYNLLHKITSVIS